MTGVGIYFSAVFVRPVALSLTVNVRQVHRSDNHVRIAGSSAGRLFSSCRIGIVGTLRFPRFPPCNLKPKTLHSSYHSKFR